MASWGANDGLDLDEDREVNVTDWQNELLGCGSDPTTCLYATCCPLFAAGEIYTNAGLGNCCIGFLLQCFFPVCHPCCVTARIRKKYAIQGNAVSDCLIWCFCEPCQLTRELREVREVRDERGY